MFGRFIEYRQLPSNKSPLSERTARSYRQAAAFFHPVLGKFSDETEVKALMTKVIDQALESGQMIESGVNVYIRSINSFFSYSHKEGWLGTLVKLDQIDEGERQPPTVLIQNGLSAWLGFDCVTISEFRVVAIASLMLDTGIRIDEALQIKLKDIQWDASRVWVKGKGKSSRHVPLSTEGQRTLRRFLFETADTRKKNSDSFLFATRNGTAMSYRNALRDLKTVGGRIQSEWVTWHTFRRTFATFYLRNGGLLTDSDSVPRHWPANQVGEGV
jgi:site-specific recombinase XerD